MFKPSYFLFQILIFFFILKIYSTHSVHYLHIFYKNIEIHGGSFFSVVFSVVNKLKNVQNLNPKKWYFKLSESFLRYILNKMIISRFPTFKVKVKIVYKPYPSNVFSFLSGRPVIPKKYFVYIPEKANLNTS